MRPHASAKRTDALEAALRLTTRRAAGLLASAAVRASSRRPRRLCSGAKRPTNSQPRVIASHPHGAHRLLPTAAVPPFLVEAAGVPRVTLACAARGGDFSLSRSQRSARALSLVFRQRRLTDSGEHAAQRHGAVLR